MNFRLTHLFVLIFFVCQLVACDDGGEKPEEPEEPVNTGTYTIQDLVADTTATSSGSAKTIFYSLEENKIIPASYAQTNRWDIAFLGIYNSSIVANNGTGQNSPGYGGPGKGGIYMMKYDDIDAEYYDEPGEPLKSLPPRELFDEAFDRITTVPIEDNQFLTSASINLDYFAGTTDGWAYYDFGGVMFPGRADKAHVCYAMPRPLIVRTAKGNYAKVIIYSLYKGAPADPDRSHKPGYFTLKFTIQKDGSKNLDLE